MDVATAMLIVAAMPIITTAFKEWRDARRSTHLQKKIDENTKLTETTNREMNGMKDALVKESKAVSHAEGRAEGIVQGESDAAARAEKG